VGAWLTVLEKVVGGADLLLDTLLLGVAQYMPILTVITEPPYSLLSCGYCSSLENACRKKMIMFYAGWLV